MPTDYLPRKPGNLLPLEEVQKRLAAVGICLLSSVFRGNNSTHDFQGIACGHTWSGRALHYLHGRGCPTCGNLRRGAACRDTSESVTKRLAKRGFKLLDPYRNARDPHRFQCREGHIWTTGPHHVLTRGSGCPVCAGQVIDLDVIKRQLEQKGIALISEYKGALQKSSFRCNRGHVWSTTVYSVVNAMAGGCAQCFAEDKEKKARDTLKQRQIEIVGAYLGTVEDHPLRCLTCGHQWISPLYLNCVKCFPHAYGVEEEKVRETIEKMTGHKFPRCRPAFLKGRGRVPLELDGYCENLQIAFEYQGKWHYLPGHWSNGVDSLREQKLRDDRKRKACQRQGVLLICVPYWKKDIDAFLKGKLAMKIDVH